MSKNVQTTPTCTYCNRSRPLPYCNPNCRTPGHWKNYPAPSHHPTTHNIKAEVRAFCLLDSCRRKYLCDNFGTEFVAQKILHNCCDICARSCSCDCCFEKALATCSVHTTSPRENVKDPRSICKDMLISY